MEPTWNPSKFRPENICARMDALEMAAVEDNGIGDGDGDGDGDGQQGSGGY